MTNKKAENKQVQVGVDFQAALVRESIVKTLNESGLPITMTVSLLQEILTLAVQSRDQVVEQQKKDYEAAVEASQKA